jgi:succinyl-CoA synthetase beta subunit
MEKENKGDTLQTTEAVGLTETAQIQAQTSEGGWEDCEHKSWEELKEDGWKFEYLSLDGYVAMTRNGYINHFRNNPKRGAN